MFTFSGIPEDQLKLFFEALEDESLMRRAQAIVEQRRVARAALSMGGQKVSRGKHGTLLQMPKANIDPMYYHSRAAQEREANEGRMLRGENIWEDPEFLEFELRNNPELRPVLDDRNAPVHMNGVELPTEAGFQAAKANRAPTTNADDKLLITT